MSYVRQAGLDATRCITEARLLAGLSIDQCLNLCNVTARTWRRWTSQGAPLWAIRLVLSQHGSLDRFGWKYWEIRAGYLYNNQLHQRYFWTPAHLLLPLYGAREAHVPFAGMADNLSSLEHARARRDHATAQQPSGLDRSTDPDPIAHKIDRD